MIKKLISSIFAGAYIGIGATTYLLSEDKFFGSIMFTVGIFLVMNFFDMLYTKVVPFFTQGYYSIQDIFITILGNLIGGTFYGLLISFTRLSDKLIPKVEDLITTKINDNILSLLIMSMLCGVTVAYAVLVNKRYESQKGIGIFFYVLFISAFVICGFDHIVANIFYYSFYSFTVKFDYIILFNFLIVLVGNTIGGLIVGYSEKYRLKN